VDEAAQILKGLRGSAVALDELRAPPAPGVYGFYLASRSALPVISAPGDGPVYLGLSSNLAQREFDTHFQAGQSGFSTLRRSLGALLKDQLDLAAIPRGTGASDTNYRNYRFEDEGESRLSEWMGAHLLLGVHPVDDPRALERELIALACPPLNLTGWENPDAAEIKALRKACVDEARRTMR
jgi:hypothetical protein